MAYRLVRGCKEYPGFEVVLEKALEVLTQYSQHFRPTAVRQAILSYVDIIRIPGQSVELDDYFRLRINLPEDPFGPLGGFVIQCYPAARHLIKTCCNYRLQRSQKGKVTASVFVCDGNHCVKELIRWTVATCDTD